MSVCFEEVACIVWLYRDRPAKVDASGLVNSIPAVAYHFCLNLATAFTQPGDCLLADLCSGWETW